MTTKKELIKYLKINFGFSSFKPGQQDVIQNLLAGHSTLGILPTGTGKSLCYHFFGSYTDSKVLVISPLLSLMQDQVEQMHLKGEKRVIALNSNLSFQGKKQILRNLNEYYFFYLAPEMLSNPQVIQAFKKIKIGLLVVDEAHCISAWGPDFRPDYLRLGKIRAALDQPLTLALTATATKHVAQDIISQLNLPATTKLVRHSVDRTNIFLAVEKISEKKQKNQRLIELIDKLPVPGLVYFSSKKQCTQIAELLQVKTKLRVAAYHAGMPSNERYAVQQQFLGDKIDLICATSAFGMGINKSNIRYVIHYHISQDLESYVQEIGRAGRDGKQSLAIVLYSVKDKYLQARLALSALPTSDELDIYQRSQKVLLNNAVSAENAQLVLRYQQMGISFSKMADIFAQRRHQKMRALQRITAYINTTGCKRKFILDYFGEHEKMIHNRVCCQIGNTEFDPTALFGLPRKNLPPVEQSEVKDYRQILRKLFREASEDPSNQ